MPGLSLESEDHVDDDQHEELPEHLPEEEGAYESEDHVDDDQHEELPDHLPEEQGQNGLVPQEADKAREIKTEIRSNYVTVSPHSENSHKLMAKIRVIRFVRAC